MKISPAHIAALRAAVTDEINRLTRDTDIEQYHAALAREHRASFADEVYRWHIIYSIPISLRRPLMDEISAYADDTQLSIALRHVFETLDPHHDCS